MKKMTWDEWKEHELAKRAKKMWDDPSVKDEDIPAVKFEFDRELGEMVFTGYLNQVEH